MPPITAMVVSIAATIVMLKPEGSICSLRRTQSRRRRFSASGIARSYARGRRRTSSPGRHRMSYRVDATKTATRSSQPAHLARHRGILEETFTMRMVIAPFGSVTGLGVRTMVRTAWRVLAAQSTMRRPISLRGRETVGRGHSTPMSAMDRSSCRVIPGRYEFWPPIRIVPRFDLGLRPSSSPPLRFCDRRTSAASRKKS